jgi:hypothetical protein
MNNIDTTCEVNIPPIPSDLLMSMEQAQTLPRVELYNKDNTHVPVEWYRVYTCNQELRDWVIAHFPVEIELVEYIVSEEALLAHVDLGRNQAYNYLLDPGGKNIVTEFYTADRTQMINSMEYQPNKWYILNVGLPHQVAGKLDSPRFLISVTPKAGVTYKFKANPNTSAKL